MSLSTQTKYLIYNKTQTVCVYQLFPHFRAHFNVSVATIQSEIIDMCRTEMQTMAGWMAG